MQTLPREDFPVDAGHERWRDRALPRRRRWREMVAKTQFAITGEDTRFFLNGALFLLSDVVDDPGRHRRPSTGPGLGCRASRRTMGRSGGRRPDDGEARVILPKRRCGSWLGLLGEGDGKDGEQ